MSLCEPICHGGDGGRGPRGETREGLQAMLTVSHVAKFINICIYIPLVHWSRWWAEAQRGNKERAAMLTVSHVAKFVIICIVTL